MLNFRAFAAGAVLLLALLPCSAQVPLPSEQVAVSVRGLWNATQHTPSFSNLPGTVDCGTYTSGSGTGFGGGIGLEYPLGDRLTIGLSGLFIERGGKLTTPNDSEPAFDSTSGRIVNIISENALDVRLRYVEVAPQLWWTPLVVGRSTFRLTGALRFGIPLQAQLQQTRRILEPDNASYTSNQQRLINWTGGYQPIRDVRTPTIGASIGVEHLLPIGSAVHLLQHLTYDYFFTSPVRNASWRLSGLRAELGVRVALRPSPPQPPPPAQPQPPALDTAKPVIAAPAPLPAPTLSVRILGIDGHIDEGNELIATPPLVTAVFFEQNSAAIPERYARRPHDSVPTSDPVEAHRNVLLRIADLVRRNPRSRLILEGAVAGSFENNDTALARRRAAAVAEALRNLGVPADRIELRALPLPRVPSNMDYPEGRAENQRVDIIVVNAPLVEYVSKQTFAEFRGTLRLAVAGNNTTSGAAIRIRATGATNYVSGDTGTVVLPIAVRLANPAARTQRLEIEAELEGTSVRTRVDTVLDLAQFERRRVELSTARFEAVLRFDYNSSVLSEDNRHLLEQLVARLPEGATVEIGGSADILGDEARNRKLAQDRAHATEEFLRTIAAAKRLRIVARGIERRFTDQLPEGRFLNRSIRVTLP